MTQPEDGAGSGTPDATWSSKRWSVFEAGPPEGATDHAEDATEDPWAFLRDLGGAPSPKPDPLAPPADNFDAFQSGQWGPSLNPLPAPAPGAGGPTFAAQAQPAASWEPPHAPDPFGEKARAAAARVSPPPAPTPSTDTDPFGYRVAAGLPTPAAPAPVAPIAPPPPIPPAPSPAGSTWAAPVAAGPSVAPPAPAPTGPPLPLPGPPAGPSFDPHQAPTSPGWPAPAGPGAPGGWHPGPGYPPPPGPWNPKAGRRRSGPLLIIGAVVAFALVAAGLAAGNGVFTRSSGPTYPKVWDPRVADLVKFVETTRHHSFQHPVEVDFLTDSEYSDVTRVDAGDVSDSDQQDMDDQVALLRSIGVVSGAVDLLASQNEITDDGTLAFYSPTDKKVRVRGTDLSVDLKVTLVHELTHALQDQLFDLGRMDKMTNSGAVSAYRSLAEGDAVRVEDAYVDSLSADDQKTYKDVHSSDADQAQSQLDSVPQYLQASFASPYYVGPPLTELLADRGTTVLDNAFKHPPGSVDEAFDYRAFLQGEAPVSVAKPAIPTNASEITSGDVSADSWFLMLAQRIDGVTALDAVDGWAGDSYVEYRTDDDTTCFEGVYQGKSDAEGAQMLAAVQQWAATMAAEAHTAVSSPAAGQVLVTSCDPGPDVDMHLTDRALDVLVLPTLRLYMALGAQQGGLSPEDAADFGACALDHMGEAKALSVGKNGVTASDVIGSTDLSACRNTNT